MIIQAVFTGTDSLGYKKGTSYRLKVCDVSCSTIQREDGTGGCTYNSLASFLRNWSDIKVLIPYSVNHKKQTT